MTRADRLAEAARLRLVKGHNDTCQHALLPDYPCNCGHDALVAALTAYRSGPHVDIDALVEDLLYEITPDHAVTPERRERVRAVLREAGMLP